MGQPYLDMAQGLFDDIGLKFNPSPPLDPEEVTEGSLELLFFDRTPYDSPIKMDLIGMLPWELQEHLLGFLERKDMGSLRLGCFAYQQRTDSHIRTRFNVNLQLRDRNRFELRITGEINRCMGVLLEGLCKTERENAAMSTIINGWKQTTKMDFVAIEEFEKALRRITHLEMRPRTQYFYQNI